MSPKRKSTTSDTTKHKTNSRGRASNVAPKTRKPRMTSEPFETDPRDSIIESFPHEDLHMDETTEQINDLKSLEMLEDIWSLLSIKKTTQKQH
ncbi:hypothetical protein P9112_000138 [Eukaryota sp. TZLM1-RC]